MAKYKFFNHCPEYCFPCFEYFVPGEKVKATEIIQEDEIIWSACAEHGYKYLTKEDKRPQLKNITIAEYNLLKVLND